MRSTPQDSFALRSPQIGQAGRQCLIRPRTTNDFLDVALEAEADAAISCVINVIRLALTRQRIVTSKALSLGISQRPLLKNKQANPDRNYG